MSISGGTDIAGCFCSGDPTIPVWRGEIQGRTPGMATDVFDSNGTPLPLGKGELVCTKSFPSKPIYFWNDPDGSRYHNTYFDRFENVWCHGDWAELTDNDGLIITGRSDALLNPGGVRIGTAEIYRQVERIPEIVESIAVGQDWQGDVRIVLFVVLKEGEILSESLQNDIKQVILAT